MLLRVVSSMTYGSKIDRAHNGFGYSFGATKLATRGQKGILFGVISAEPELKYERISETRG